MPFGDAPVLRHGDDHPPCPRLLGRPEAPPLTELDLDEFRAYAPGRSPAGVPPLRRPLDPTAPAELTAAYPADGRHRPATPAAVAD